MATTISSTNLDFAQIRESLKTYFERSSEFADYDFEGAALSNLLDVLAHNTHYNGLIANFALNESFISTAQLRSSLLAHAESLGLSVRSRTSATAELKLSVDLSTESNKPSSITLPTGTVFSGTGDDGTYKFRTLKSYTATDDGTGVYTFKNSDGEEKVLVTEGVEKTKTFFVGGTTERQIYVIPEKNLDSTTATVKVYETPTSTSFDTYTPLSQAIKVTADSTYFTLRETPNEFFELNFGDGVTFGKSPEAGNKIVATYLVSKGALGNGVKTFTTQATIEVNSTDHPIDITLVTKSAGGDSKQTNEEIRQEAPVAFASQNRLVTAADYETMIRTNYTQVEDVSAWGGEQAVPRDYGKVYIALDFDDALSESQKSTIKSNITANHTDRLGVMSISTEFKDPEELYFNLECNIQFNPEKTSTVPSVMEARVLNLIQNHFNSDLNGFKKTFRKSTLLTKIDQMSDAILSSSIRIKNQLRFEPTLNTAFKYKIQFPFAIAAPDDDTYTVNSSFFTVNGSSKTVQIQNKLSTRTLQLVATDGTIVVDNIGEFDSLKGTVELFGFHPVSIFDGSDSIKVIVTPNDQNTVRPMRNYTMKLDSSLSYVKANEDRNQVLSRI